MTDKEKSLKKIISFAVEEFDKDQKRTLTVYEVINILESAIKMVKFTTVMTPARECLDNLRKAPF